MGVALRVSKKTSARYCMMAKLLVRIAILMFLCITTGCEWLAGNRDALPNTEESWHRLGLERLWSARSSNTQVRNVWIVDRFLILETEDNVLDIFDRFTGTYLFPVDLKRPVVGHPVFVVDKEHVEHPIERLYIIATSKLYELRLDSQSVERGA